jgi:hypothetical protein
MSMTDRVDQAAGILRQHDTFGLLPIPDTRFAQKIVISTPEICENRKTKSL